MASLCAEPEASPAAEAAPAGPFGFAAKSAPSSNEAADVAALSDASTADAIPVPGPKHLLSPETPSWPSKSTKDVPTPTRSTCGETPSRAFCAVLHGPGEHFFVYALLLGLRLRKFCRGVDRVLLCEGKWWQDTAARSALQKLYTDVREVELVNAPNATSVQRHKHVFTKLKALLLPYQQVVLLDLDLVPCRDLTPLFQVPAPAGMHHGDSPSGELIHGEKIPLGRSKWWCANAGVLRLDPQRTERERQQEVAGILGEVAKISQPTSLPEQYYLARRLKGWRHLDPRWNMEVGLYYDDPGFTWPRAVARKASTTSRGKLWLEQKMEDVCVFHFSGTHLEPWWFSDLTPEAAYQTAVRQWRHRDPRCLVARALREWCAALSELEEEVASWPAHEREPVEEALRDLRTCAAEHRALTARAARPRKCKRCGGSFQEEEGRWLLGWEGWWLCRDCVVDYILSDEDPGPAACCWICGSVKNSTGQWERHRGQLWWNCGCSSRE